ncbi:hypothetical protein QRD89_07920 [Halobacillus sp. ACCC02827]|uniref:hypothetical protein n=1 Tax=unclassified Halobacillus TaxID=2636472 RepID=UPI0002A4E236|nr:MULTISPECIES: hypothetical protein [unclassified Halobacillus]ELK44598.1 hypothetical protein D479_18589 [Halobacillus sp. BAB-2008]WJE17261.1 hypothetical protein QRD89_07920 [Halobacillus sp. ACCC02827]
MYANQRISSPYFPSHSTHHPPHNQFSNERLNHWCEEVDRCEHYEEQRKNEQHHKSKIAKLAAPTFTI